MKLFSPALMAILLTACGSTPRPSPDFPSTAFRADDGYDQQYLLWPGDTIEVTVLTAPELSRTVTIAPDGRIRIPLAGSLTAAGRTVDEVSAALIYALTDQLKDPDVEVIATGFGSQRIFVGGSVGQPAMYDLPGQIDPLQAIIMAGGFTTEARAKQVVLMRRLPGDRIKTQLVNVKSGIFDPELAKWGPLQRFDVVYVPRSRIAEQNQFIQQWVRNALPIEFSLFYDVRNGN